MSAERVERLRKALVVYAESDEPHVAYEALRADDEAARQETPDPSAREAAEEWVASHTSYQQAAVYVVLAKPRPVQDAIRDLLSGGDQ